MSEEKFLVENGDYIYECICGRAVCPYCEISKEPEHFNSFLHSAKKIKNNIHKVTCTRCESDFWYIEVNVLNFHGSSESVFISLTREQYKELKETLFKHLRTEQYFDFPFKDNLPEVVAKRVNNLVKSLKNNDDLAMRSFALRSVIEAVFFDAHGNEIKGLSKHIKDVVSDDGLAKNILGILGETNKTLHVNKEDIEEELFNGCCNFIYYWLLKEYWFEPELKKAKNYLSLSGSDNIFKKAINKDK